VNKSEIRIFAGLFFALATLILGILALVAAIAIAATKGDPQVVYILVALSFVSGAIGMALN